MLLDLRGGAVAALLGESEDDDDGVVFLEVVVVVGFPLLKEDSNVDDTAIYLFLKK